MKRRAFLQCVAVLPVADGLHISSQRLISDEAIRYRYRACEREIQIWRRQAGSWQLIQRVPSERPGSLILSSRRNLLFAVNQIDEYDSLPRGSVQSFSVDAASGEIRPIERRALSLSSTFPRSCALSPDGSYLVVAAYGGGTYNVLPISGDGTIGPVCHVRKEVGNSADPMKQRSAHPHSVVFHPSGEFVIATDFGSDRINVFGFSNGRLSLIAQQPTLPASGPGSIGLDSSGKVVTCHCELSGQTERYTFDNGRPKLLVKLPTAQFEKASAWYS